MWDSVQSLAVPRCCASEIRSYWDVKSFHDRSVLAFISVFNGAQPCFHEIQSLCDACPDCCSLAREMMLLMKDRIAGYMI